MWYLNVILFMYIGCSHVKQSVSGCAFVELKYSCGSFVEIFTAVNCVFITFYYSKSIVFIFFYLSRGNFHRPSTSTKTDRFYNILLACIITSSRFFIRETKDNKTWWRTFKRCNILYYCKSYVFKSGLIRNEIGIEGKKKK